jgi:Protein of unknown function (DUF742)
MDSGEEPRNDFVRPFIITGGRTKANNKQLRMETMLQASRAASGLSLALEQREIVELCRRAQSIAEVSARLHLALGVVTVLADDLISAGALEVHHTDPVEIQLSTLTRMIERVRAI